MFTEKSTGGDNKLGVALAPYDPHVQCVEGSIGPPGSIVPPLGSCDAVAGLMFATRGLTSFGKSGSGARYVVPGADAGRALHAAIWLPYFADVWPWQVQIIYAF